MAKGKVWKRMVCAWLTMALVPVGCGSNIEYPPLKQGSISEGPHAPNQTIARLRECVEEHGGDLGGQGFEFHYNVKVDEDGRAASVKSDVFHADFDGCTRAALRAMEISPEFLRTWVLQPLLSEEREDGQTNAARASVGNLVMVMGVAVTLAPIIIKAAGITIIFAITLEIAEEVVEAIRRRRNWKDKCTDGYEECMDSKVGDELGNNWNESRCEACRRKCQKDGSWPPQIQMWDELLPCGGLEPTWRKN